MLCFVLTPQVIVAQPGPELHPPTPPPPHPPAHPQQSESLSSPCSQPGSPRGCRKSVLSSNPLRNARGGFRREAVRTPGRGGQIMGQNTPSACFSIPGPPTRALGHQETSWAHTGPNLPLLPDPALPIQLPQPALNKGDCSPRKGLQGDVCPLLPFLPIPPNSAPILNPWEGRSPNMTLGYFFLSNLGSHMLFCVVICVQILPKQTPSRNHRHIFPHWRMWCG